ncbi:hypothetical protein [Bacillus piscicola]|uniref:hypothetical protein n=1 Tax=Bacillus piscicola TaxID=1632684 RepID=UPI001F09F298|nr:hypothetical protein [Bacillus piscicola]
MKIVILLAIVFVISFLLIFKLVYSGNKEETKEEKINFLQVLFVTGLLALLPTIAIGLIVFALLGSAHAVNMIFSLQVSTSQLIVLAVSFFVYLFTVDSVIEIIVEYIIGKNIVSNLTMLLIRIGVFYLIGAFAGLDQTVNITIAAGIGLIILIVETLYNWREKNKANNVEEE